MVPEEGEGEEKGGAASGLLMFSLLFYISLNNENSSHRDCILSVPRKILFTLPYLLSRYGSSDEWAHFPLVSNISSLGE